MSFSRQPRAELHASWQASVVANGVEWRSHYNTNTTQTTGDASVHRKTSCLRERQYTYNTISAGGPAEDGSSASEETFAAREFFRGAAQVSARVRGCWLGSG